LTDAAAHSLAVVILLLAMIPAVLAWRGARRSATGFGLLFGVLYLLPVVPRLWLALFDRERYVAQFGAAALGDLASGMALAVIVAASVALMLPHGRLRRGAPRLFWCGWTLQFLLAAFLAYLAWGFRIF
jgi:hypothetical protein